MLNALENRRAWVTQRFANRYPPWSKLRKLAQSIGQQILEPAGRELADVYWWTNYNLDNYLLNTSDVAQFEGIYRLPLPSTFNFRTTHHVDAVMYLDLSSVRGQTDSGWITLTQATNNSLEEFWYGVPDRTTLGSESYTYSPVVPNTQVTSLSTVAPVRPSVSGKLWVTLSNNGASLKNYKGGSVRSAVKITGRDIHGREAVERMLFAYNGTIQTKTAWSEVDSVATEYIDDVAYIRIDWLSKGQTEILDMGGLHVTRDNEKFRFWSLGSQSYGSTLQHLVFSADNVLQVQEGEDSKHAEYEIELLDSDGTNVSGVYLNSWPKRHWIVVTDGTKLHFYIPDVKIENLEPIVEATTEAVVQIELDREWSTKNATVTLDYNMKRPFVRVLRTRWSVQKPDGTRVGIDEDGTETVFGSSGWVDHPEGSSTFSKVGFQGNYIDYTLTDHGRYVFFLESLVSDGLTTESATRPVAHMDVRVVHSAYTTAESSVTLPASVGTASMVGFDAYQRPWVVNTNGVAYLLNFHHDKYMVDFTEKTIFVREEYTNLEVEA